MKYFIAALLADLAMAVWGYLDYQKFSKVDASGVAADGIVVDSQRRIAAVGLIGSVVMMALKRKPAAE